jgi:hypothetical protein
VGEATGATVSGSDTGRTGPEESVDRAAETAETAIQQVQTSTEERIAGARDAATEVVRRTEDQVKAKIRETEAKARAQVAEVQDTIAVVKRGLSEPTPAGSVDEAVRQAGDLRRAIDRDIDALQAKLPPADELKDQARTYGGAAAGVLAVAGAAAVGLKQRGERKRVEREARAHAAAISQYLPDYLPQAFAAAAAESRTGRSRSGRGVTLLLTVVAAAIGAVIVRQRAGTDDEPDLWGPA